MLRLFFLSIVSVFLAACAGTPGPAQNLDLSDIPSSDIQQFINTDGENLLCDQSAYTACLDIEKSACVTQAVPLRQECAVFTEDNITGGINEENKNQYLWLFVRCMVYKQGILYPQQAPQLSSCMAEKGGLKKPTLINSISSAPE